MADFFPDIDALDAPGQQSTWGERRVARRLSQVLDNQTTVWIEPRIGHEQSHPDFVILHPQRGLLVLEVKDWYVNKIARIDSQNVVLDTREGPRSKRNPIEQARGYAMQIERLLQKDERLVRSGGEHQGKLRFPYAYGVVLTRITRAEFDKAGLGNVMTPRLVLCSDDLDDNIIPSMVRKRMWDMFWPRFGCKLHENDVNQIRTRISPSLKPASLPAGSPEPSAPASRIDQQRELLAHNFDDARSAIAEGNLRQAGHLLNTLVIESRTALGERDSDTLEYASAFAEHLSRTGETARAHQLMLRLVEQQSEVVGDRDPRTVKTRLDFARSLKRIGAYADAIEQFEAVLVVRRRFGGSHPQTLDISEQIAECRTFLGQYDKALELLETIVDRRKASQGDSHLDTLRAHAGIARVMLGAGRYASARDLLGELIEVSRNDSEIASNQAFYWLLCTRRADAEIALGNVGSALQTYREAHQFYSDAIGETTPPAVTACAAIGRCKRLQGELNAALEFLHHAQDVLVQRLGSEHPAVFQIRREMAICLLDLGRIDKGLSLQERTLGYYRGALGDDNPETIATMAAFGRALARAGEMAAGRALLEEATGKARRTLGDRHPTTLTAITAHARTLGTAGLTAAASELLDESLDMLINTLGESHPLTLEARHVRGELLFASEQLADAERCFATTAAERAIILGVYHPQTLESEFRQACTLMQQRQTGAALPLLRKVLKTRNERSRDVAVADRISVKVELANALITLNKTEDARVELNQAALMCSTALRALPKSELAVDAGRARLALEMNEPHEAAATYMRVLKRSREVFAEDDPALLALLTAAGNSLRQSERPEQGRALLEEAVARSRRILGDAHHQTRKRVQILALCLMDLNDLDGARKLKIEAARARSGSRNWDGVKDTSRITPTAATPTSSKSDKPRGPSRLH